MFCNILHNLNIYLFRFSPCSWQDKNTVNKMQTQELTGRELWKKLSCEPDIMWKIVCNISMKDINTLESSSKLFETMFEETGIWKRKISKEFPSFEMDDECQDLPSSEIYWQLRNLGHICNRCYNLCNICLGKTHCFNITKCESCDSSNYLKPL